MFAASKSRTWIGIWMLALSACGNETALVASNCMSEGGCLRAELRAIDKVDILLVIDDSLSLVEEYDALRRELPRLLNSITKGQAEDTDFPPVASVHVAVVTSDMGIGPEAPLYTGCSPEGDDGLFVKAGEHELTCETEYSAFLEYSGGGAALATADTVSCLPLLGTEGCGFEMPLEALLKALWPKSDPSVEFRSGTGHGEDANAGFIRSDSLLVIVVVTDEDDCSTDDSLIFQPPEALDPADPEQAKLGNQGLNVRCQLNPERLFPIERYGFGLDRLRSAADDVIFAVIGGIPPELVSDAARGAYDFTSVAGAQAYYDDILADERMEYAIVDGDGVPGLAGALPRPACQRDAIGASPPRRLIEVARGFGARGVLGSICDEDFGNLTGQLVRALGDRIQESTQ
ncbi:MAG: hypothetical protein OEZ06_29860 [Myxococcales bacterium]|nr:hypothetical protein [Myxococcales bacterium]